MWSILGCNNMKYSLKQLDHIYDNDMWYGRSSW